MSNGIQTFWNATLSWASGGMHCRASKQALPSLVGKWLYDAAVMPALQSAIISTAVLFFLHFPERADACTAELRSKYCLEPSLVGGWLYVAAVMPALQSAIISTAMLFVLCKLMQALQSAIISTAFEPPP
jgi:hypothetical protein